MNEHAQHWFDDFVAWRDRERSQTELVMEGVRSMKLHTPTRALITNDGAIIPIEHAVSMEEIHTIIGCDAVDTVSLFDGVHVMCLDDSQSKKGLPRNELATKFYFQKCGGAVPWVIGGHVVIVPDADFVPPDMRAFHDED